METIGEKIRELRKRKGLSQEDLAFELDVSRQTIHKWENDTTQPSAEKIKLLSAFFDVSPSLLLGEKEDLHSDEVAFTDNTKINKKGLVIRCIVFAFTLILLAVVIVFTVGSGLIAFTNNLGHERVASFYVDTTLFYMLLSLSVILLALNIIMVFHIIKAVK